MSVTAPAGFRAAALSAGLKPSGRLDFALLVNDGPTYPAAGVFTANRVKAAPVLWSQQVLRGGVVRAVALNSGHANACTGPAGFQAAHATAEAVGAALEVSASEVAVCSTGLIGGEPPTERILAGVWAAAGMLTDEGGPDAAEAIRTTDTVAKQVVVTENGWTLGGMAKGAAMLAPGLATMLAVLTTDALANAAELDKALRAATCTTFDRVDSDGCMSTNDTVLLLASGASGRTPSYPELVTAVHSACADLAGQLLADAEGATKDIAITVTHAASVDDAVEVARAIARSNLLKCALHGADPNWGRILAAAGTTTAAFDPLTLDSSINGVWVCRDSAPAADPDSADLTGREILIELDLKAGDATATVWTSDLTADYVYKNSAYST